MIVGPRHGRRSFVAIAEWIADLPGTARADLGLTGPIPVASTVWRLLTAVDPAARYHYAFDAGPRRHAGEPGARWPVVRGATLIALAEERYPDAGIAAEAKQLMREVLDHHLESRRIESRRIVADLRSLEGEE